MEMPEKDIEEAGHSPTALCKVNDRMKQALTPAHLRSTI